MSISMFDDPRAACKGEYEENKSENAKIKLINPIFDLRKRILRFTLNSMPQN